MESKAKYTLVGSLILLLCVLIVFAVLWLSEAGGMRDAKYFSIYFEKHSIYGLQVDSYVTMRGVRLGSVRSIGISPKNIEQVRVVLVLSDAAPVKTDTVAVINRNLLTGYASIDLPRGTQNAKALTEVPPGEEFPVITEASSDLEQITNSVPELVEKIGSLTTRVEALISEENIKSVGGMLKNFNEVSEVLAKNKGELDGAMKKIGAATEEFAKVTKALNEFTSENNGRLAQLSDEFMASMKELRATVSTFKEESSVLMSSLTGTAQVLGQQIALLAQNLGEAAQKTSSTLEAYQQPRKILAGPSKNALGPGESR